MRGLILILYTIITWYFCSAFLILPSYLLGLIFGEKNCRGLTKFLTGLSMSNVSFFLHHVLRIPMYTYGTEINLKGTNVFIMNHRSSLDFLFFISLICQTDDPEKLSIVLKSVLKFVPGMGWTVYVNDFLLLNRKFKEDKNYISQKMRFDDDKTILIFPEGTRFCPKKLYKCNEYSLKNNYPLYENVLLPKSKGTYNILIELLKQGKLNGFYDLTINFEGIDKNKAHTTKDLIMKDDIKSVHFHINKIDINTIPTNDNNFKIWLQNLFVKKDNLLNTNLQLWPLKKKNKENQKLCIVSNNSVINNLFYLFNDKIKEI